MERNIYRKTFPVTSQTPFHSNKEMLYTLFSMDFRTFITSDSLPFQDIQITGFFSSFSAVMLSLDEPKTKAFFLL